MSRFRFFARTSPAARPAAICLLAALVLTACAAPGISAGTAPDADTHRHAVQAWITSTDRSKLLARETDVVFSDAAPLPDNIEINPSVRYQEMVGFGAAITDSSAWLIQNKLGDTQRSALLQELFGTGSGLGLNFIRLTIGASDFSRTLYSLDDIPPGQTDPTLAHFSIDANRADVLPVVKSALAINPQLLVMASPWSAPGWMKTTDSLIKGSLRPEAYGALSDYLLRYVEAYTWEGVPIYALTLQNEPHFEPADYPGMRLDAVARAQVIGRHLGPQLAKRGLQTRILDWDHNWDEADSPLQVLGDPGARPYVAGVAWHCYGGNVSAQTLVHNAHPDKETYMTECSGGEWGSSRHDALTWMTRNLIIGATRAWAKGVLLWNMALDENHGPYVGGCKNCRGVVTIDSVSGEITRNPEYYVLAHASRFVRPGAHRIESSTLQAPLDAVAFQNADDQSLVLIVANSTPESRRFSVQHAKRTFQYELPANSIATFAWKSSTVSR